LPELNYEQTSPNFNESTGRKLANREKLSLEKVPHMDAAFSTAFRECRDPQLKNHARAKPIIT
jgi:hypothetical protein